MRRTVESLQGQLLVASPAIDDPNFSRTVVAIANHDEDGALGVILNRVSDTEVADVVPDLAHLVDAGELVHIGGPVQAQAIVVLAEFHKPAHAAFLVTDRVGLVAERTELDALDGITDRRRVYAGYAGWAPGQLEAELERDDWIVTPALADDIFCPDPRALWGAVLERKGGEFRLLARMPPDPSVN